MAQTPKTPPQPQPNKPQSKTSQTSGSGGAGLTSVRIGLGRNFLTRSDPTIILLWSLTLLLTGFGLIMVLSASSITSYLSDGGFFGGFLRQGIFALLGIPLMIVASRMPLKFWKSASWAVFGLALALQALVFTPLGVEVGGNRNWLEIGQFRAQPAEFLKLALILWMAAVLHTKSKLIGKTIHALIPAVIPGAALALALVLLGRDLGTGLVLFAITFAVLFYAEVNWRALVLFLITSAAVIIVLVVSSPNRMRRLLGLTGEGDDYSGHDWQPLHGVWALAGGGVFGVGLGGSKAKWSWLPAADNDYIFAVIGEELGLIGALLVIALYVGLVIAMLRVMKIARNSFGRAVVGGIMVWIVGQAFVNIGVVLRVLPVIGVPLPLISAGGTALVSCLVAMGVVISIARDGIAYQQEIAGAQSTERERR